MLNKILEELANEPLYKDFVEAAHNDLNKGPGELLEFLASQLPADEQSFEAIKNAYKEALDAREADKNNVYDNDSLTGVYKRAMSLMQDRIDLISLGQEQDNLEKFLLSDEGKPLAEMLYKSKYWDDARFTFCLNLSTFALKFISDNLQEFIAILNRHTVENPNFIDDMLAELAGVKEYDPEHALIVNVLYDFKEYIVKEYRLEDKKRGRDLKKDKPLEKVDKVYAITSIKWFTDRISNVLVDKINEAALSTANADGILAGSNGYAQIKSNNKVDDSILLKISTPKELTFDDILKSFNLDKLISNFDKLVYMIICSLYDAGNKQITISMICECLNCSKRPSKTMMDRVINSISKMRMISLTINNKKEVEAYPNYKLIDERMVYFLPVETHKQLIYVRNMETKYTIDVLKRPPLADIAIDRNNYIDVTTKVLSDADLRLTDQNIAILDYLVQRTYMATPNKNRADKSEKITFKNMFDRCHLDQRKQQERAPEKAEKLLRAFKKNNLIENYSINWDNKYLNITIKKRKG